MSQTAASPTTSPSTTLTEHPLELERQGPVAHIWLNRPHLHNAVDEHLIERLTQAFQTLDQDPAVRLIVLAGRGPSLCAGADIAWMKRQGEATPEANLADARLLAALFHTIASTSKPTVARVHGRAFGAGVGLVAACDIAIASSDATFATPEVRLGLIPATIAPYVLRAIGERHARRLFQTGERVDAPTAERLGLIHESVPPEDLDATINTTIAKLLEAAPQAQRAVKSLIDELAHHPITPELLESTAQKIAHTRAQPEAKEGLTAFLTKRPAAWISTPDSTA